MEPDSTSSNPGAMSSRLEVLEKKIVDLEEELQTVSRPQILMFGLPYDGLISFFTRFVRMFNYGAIAPVFYLYCIELGLSSVDTGALLTCILVGDLVITLYLSTRADQFGRRLTLVIGSLLKILAGVAFASTSSFPILVAAGIVGVISTSGGEIGPFIAIEQACLTDSMQRTAELHGKNTSGAGDIAVLLGWYNAIGYLAQALGAVTSGLVVNWLQTSSSIGLSALEAYRWVFVSYGALGGVLALCYATMTRHAEVQKKKKSPAAADAVAVASSSISSSSSSLSSSSAPSAAGSIQGEGAEVAARPSAPRCACLRSCCAALLPKVSLGLRRTESIHIVVRLSVMFAMDAFAGAFVMQTWIAFWFHNRWNFDEALVGYLLMGANVVAGISGIAAAYFVKRFGAMLTMIASHLPSNILLLAVPLMPTGWAAAAMLVARFSISQMDVPARQAYVVMVVASDERSAAGGITNIVRSLGMSLAPLLLGYLSSNDYGSFLFSSPWIIAGAIKIAYDIILYTLYLCDTTMKKGEENAVKLDAKEKKEGLPSGGVVATTTVRANDLEDGKNTPLLSK